MEEEDKGEREQCCGAHEMRGDQRTGGSHECMLYTTTVFQSS
jgi:hypothetical protein